MYSGFPLWAKRATKTSLALGWGALSGAGLSALLNPSPPIMETIHLWRVVVAAGLIVFGLIAVVSVFTERYRGEWVASWVCATCLIPYVVIAWALATGSGNFAGAFLFTGLVGMLLGRGLFCSGFAARLRAEHLARAKNEHPVD